MTKANKQKSQTETKEEIELRISEQMQSGFKRNAESWTVKRVIDAISNGEIHDAPYQRGKIWDKPKQKALIETILRYGGEKIPTITLRKLEDDTLEIVDGKQRLLSTLKPFADDEFSLNGVYNPEVRGCKLSDLYKEWKIIYGSFMNCRIPLEIMEEMSDEEAVTYFIQINSSGVNVTLGEKIHAMQGTPIISTIESLKEHPIWDNISQKKRYNEYAYISRMLLFVRDKEDYTDSIKCYNSRQLLNELDIYRSVDIPTRIVDSVTETFDFLNKILLKYTFKVNITEFFSIFLYTNLYGSSLKISSFGKFISELYYQIHNYQTNQHSIFRIMKTKHTETGFKYNSQYYQWYFKTMNYMYSKYVKGSDWDDIKNLSLQG